MKSFITIMILTFLFAISIGILLFIFIFLSNYYLDVKSHSDDSSLSSINTNLSNQSNYSNIVSQVIDGDTFVLSSGRYVRLIGIDAPEEGKRYYEESKEYLSTMILNKEVELIEDIDAKDNYGRLLSYVYVTESGSKKFVNLELIKEGLAVPMTIEPNVKNKEIIDTAHDLCKLEKKNLCYS